MTQKELSIAEYKLSRRFAFQFVYQQEMSQHLFFQRSNFDNFCNVFKVPESCQDYLAQFLLELFDRAPWVDSWIEKFSKNWKKDRISKVDLSILRVAIWELEKRRELDTAVIISHCLEIAKEYGSPHSARFINGILDPIAAALRKKSE